jgi:hypothetical protein
VVRVERIVTKLDGTPLNGKRARVEVSFGITSAPPKRASASKLLELNRGHWGIENKVHWVRDVTFDEDRSQVRRHGAPHAMASVRNLAIGVLRIAGATNVAAALRHCARNIGGTLRLVGL